MRMMRLSGRPAILLPQAEGLVVLGIDGDEQPVGGRPSSLVTRFQARSIACSLK